MLCEVSAGAGAAADNSAIPFADAIKYDEKTTVEEFLQLHTKKLSEVPRTHPGSRGATGPSPGPGPPDCNTHPRLRDASARTRRRRSS